VYQPSATSIHPIYKRVCGGAGKYFDTLLLRAQLPAIGYGVSSKKKLQLQWEWREPARTRTLEKSRRGESAVFSLSSFAFGSSIKISLTFYEPKDSELTLLYLLHSPGWNGQYIKCDNGLNARLPFLCPLIFMDNYLKNCHSLKVHTIRTYLWSVKV